MSNDPVGFSNVHNFNRYAYANNNPYKYTDPNGENPLMALGAAIGGFQAFVNASKNGATGMELFSSTMIGIGIGALSGMGGGAIVKTITSKLVSTTAKKAITTTLGTLVGGVSGGASQFSTDVITGEPSTGKTIVGAMQGATSGFAGSLPGKTLDIVATALTTEAVITVPLLLANERKEAHPEKEETKGN